jgi:gluconate 5-dehydrogenase
VHLAATNGWGRFPPTRLEPECLQNKDASLSRIPQTASANDHDLQGAAVFLAADASNVVTGHVLVVEGGQSD